MTDTPKNANQSQRLPVVHFDDCVLPLPESPAETFLVDFSLHPGELVMFHNDDWHYEKAIVRAACGLLPPRSGRVSFQGRDWRTLSPDRANASRGRIGVVLRNESWIPYQSIMESLILPQLHHTRRPLDAICRDAVHWAGRFGLPGLPRDLPAAVGARDRRSANLVRAFIGSPSLIIIEHQPRALGLKQTESLINAIRDVRDRDAAVLWFSRDVAFCLDHTIPATRRLRHGGDALRPQEAAA